MPESAQPVNEHESHFDLRGFLDVLSRRRWVVYTITALVLAGGTFWTFTRQPVYRATTLLEIQRSRPNVLAFRDVLGTDPSWRGYEAFYETQYRILQSRAVARAAAEALDLPGHPLLPRHEAGPARRAWNRLTSALPRPGSWAEPRGAAVPAEPADPMDPHTGTVLSGLRINPVNDSNLVEVTWSGRHPEFASQVSNAVAEAYISFVLRSRFDTTRQASEFLNSRVGDLREEVEALEERLQAYREQRQILPSGGADQIAMKGVTDLHAIHLRARADRIEAESYWLSVRGSDPASMPDVLESPVVQRLRNDINDLEIRRAELERTFKPGWPQLDLVSRRLSEARHRLDEEVRSIASRTVTAAEATYRAALTEEQRLASLLDEQKSSAQQAGRDAIEYGSLQAEVERKRAVLDALLQRRNETDESVRLADTNAGNARIVDRARTPRSPAVPRPRVDIPLALGIGLALGVAAAFGLEAWDNTIRTPQDVERILELPTLARIPAADEDVPRRARPSPASEGVDLMSHRNPSSPLAEAFRDLRTALSLSSAGSTPDVFCVTSTRPEEGKSVVAMNLATVLAQSGRRVLLVDSDLRRPRLHRAMGARNAVGLSTLLCGKATVQETVQSTDVPNLSFLPSGPIPPNPAELLDSVSFDETLRAFREAGYGTVVLDSPPVLTVADGAILATRVEGVLMVVESDGTTRDEARRAIDKLRQVQARVLGVVLNKTDERAGGYGRYQYRYEASEAADSTDPGDEAPPAAARRSRLRGLRG